MMEMSGSEAFEVWTRSGVRKRRGLGRGQGGGWGASWVSTGNGVSSRGFEYVGQGTETASSSS